MKQTFKYIYYPFSMLVLVSAITLMGYVFYLFFKPFTLPTVTPYPIPIINPGKVVHYGEAIQTKVRSCTYDAVPTTVSVRYQNTEGRTYLFSSHDSIGQVGCRDNTLNRDPIPNSLPPGVYKIYITAVFKVSVLKSVSYVYETEEFKLVGNQGVSKP